MKNLIHNMICVLTSILFFNIGCSEFLDVNQNPNDPSVSTPSLNLPVAQQNFTSLNARNMTYLGNFLSVKWATPSNWSANQDLIRYNITSNFQTAIFESSYLNIFKDLTYIENFEDESGANDYSAYDVISKVIKGFQYQYLVDLYGDVPYSNANLRAVNPTPTYDDAEEVYKSNIDELLNAVDLALNLPDNAQNPGAQDIIFGGDMNKWAQFANSIVLRYLIRLSGTGQESYIQQQISAIEANGAGYISENVVANPGYSDNTDKQNPFYGYFVQASTGADTDRKDFTVATDYAIEYMQSTNDPRIDRLYAEAAAGGFKGAPQSTILPGSGFTSSDLSKVGPGLLKSSEQDQPIMLYSEILFLLSEAALRGFIDGGEVSAKEFYEEAILESFHYLGVADVDEAFENYMNQSGVLNVDWDATPDKLEAIITQKWVALNGTSSIESWIELTRTGYPSNLPIPEESNGVRPVKLLYPISEIARNEDNVPKQTQETAFTDMPFWKN